MSEDKKLTISGRGTLGAGRGVETGQVRQSFSHGRSKSVVVERKRRKIVKKGAAPAVPEPRETPSLEIKRPKEDAADQAQPTSGSEDEHLTARERDARAEALEAARKQEAEEQKRREEERKKAEADALERAKQAQEAAAVAEVDAEAEAKRLVEEEARRRHDEEARKEAEAEAEAEEEARKAAEAAEAKPEPAAKKPAPAAKEEEARKPKQDPKKGRPVSKGRPREDRRRSKLTISDALSGGDEVRQRSLAAFKRAQAKQKRALEGEAPVVRKTREVVVPEAITVQELANRMAEKASAVIKSLMKMGVMATINETLDQDTAELIVTEFGHTIKRVSEADVEIGLVGEEDAPEDFKPRPPVVTVMGHVDHGKTSILDALRSADVVAGEAGGITQHIGAYQVAVDGAQKITFIDTPGHAAFTEMRARGANVTDIVELVVAADDGVMPQTVEAINHAKAAEVPIVVAINKVDKTGANPDKVRQELLQHEIVVEAMSGDVLDVEMSATKKQGLDKLLEALQLQAELLELKANPDRSAEGVVVEAELDKGRGPVVTALVGRGTLRVGDIFVAGSEWGKVRALVNDHGQQIDTATPSQPVEVLGLNGTPAAGDVFAVVDSEARAREVTEYRRGQTKKTAAARAPASLETMFTALKEGEIEEFAVLVKADVQGSAEAIASALNDLSTDEIKVRILHTGVGGVTESDVTLATASQALILGFNVRANKQAREAAERDGVAIKYYSVIYDLVDEVKAAMAGQLGPELRENLLGVAEVREVFSAGKAGKVAGCMITEGTVKRGTKARLLRDDVVVFDGNLSSLRRFKDDVEEVRSGTECGIGLENYNDIKAGDRIEVYEIEEHERVL